ncbi:MAG TPA: hypothetical protein VFV52_06170 [Bacilli bacterium]|nr:hypothetical protein [Bacilli bacterium]
MAKQTQSEQGQQQQEKKPGVTPPTLPKAMEKRVSMKWLTLESLRKVIARLEAQGGSAEVLFLTAWGQVHGKFGEIRPSYAESFSQDGGDLIPDVSSMVTHLRSELLRKFEEEEQELQLVDSGPILSLTDVTLVGGGGEPTRLPQLTLFADQVIGFSLPGLPKMH